MAEIQELQDFWRTTGLNAKDFWDSRLTESARMSPLNIYGGVDQLLYRFPYPIKIQTLVIAPFRTIVPASVNDVPFDLESLEFFAVFSCSYRGIEPQTSLKLSLTPDLGSAYHGAIGEFPSMRIVDVASIRHEELDLWCDFVEVFAQFKVGDVFFRFPLYPVVGGSTVLCTLQGKFPLL